MDQQLSQMLSDNSPPPSLLSPTISTEQIQKCLEDNQQLIMFILESQRLGRLNDREMFIAQLQRNLTSLSALADVMTQPPPTPVMPPPPPSQAMGDPTKHQGHWLHPHEAARAVVPWAARQPQQVQASDDHQQPYYLHQQYFPEPIPTPTAASGDSQPGVPFRTTHNMFYVMGNNNQND